MKKIILSIVAALAAFVGYSQSTMATKKYVDGIKAELLEEISHFPYFDGTANNMRVSPIDEIGGFRFKDYSSEGDEIGMSFMAMGDGMWGFALWDKMMYPSSSRSNPYFAIGSMGFRIPTGNLDSWSNTIDWPVVWRGLNVSDYVFTDDNSNSRRSINSRALNTYMAYELPTAIGRYNATGNVYSATGLAKGMDRIATYENIIEDAAYLAATSKVVKSITYTDWTSDMTVDKDGMVLNHMEYKEGKWHVYVDARTFINHLIFSFEGDEDATELSYTDEYGTVNFSRTKTVVSENRFGLATLEDVGGVSETAVTNIVRKVVNTAGKYLWDAKDEVCWRVNMSGGFVDLVAVTNIDLTLPENHLALEAIENEWRAK